VTAAAGPAEKMEEYMEAEARTAAIRALERAVDSREVVERVGAKERAEGGGGLMEVVMKEGEEG